MEMEVMMPRDFNFDSASTTPYMSASTTPYMSAPSSPQRLGSRFYSAPTSPTRISAFSPPSAIPFQWEEKPGTPKSPSNYGGDDADFAFDFSGHLERHSLPADELFHGGQIKPLKPPPPAQSSPKSPRKIAQAFSPRRHNKSRDVDPFAAALEHTTTTDRIRTERGREINQKPASSSRERNKGSSRSLSPFRVSDLLFDHPDNDNDNDVQAKNNSNNSVFSSTFWYKKWKIKDLLLFRSASEGRAKDKEQLNKYSQLKKTRTDDVKNSSFRSTESVGSVSSRRKSGPPISAHELHYTVNRAFSEEMRRRTSLPYKQGLLGCLGFNPAAPEMSKGMNSGASLPRV